MKTRFFLVAALMLSLFSVNSFAQMDERKPGLYAVSGEDFAALPYSYNTSLNGGVGIGGVNIGHNVYKFKGETSGVVSNGTFVLVIDPEKKSAVISKNKFDVFNKTMNPDNMLILPLTVNMKNSRREYDAGTTVGVGGVNVNTKSEVRYPFEWEQISDNSFLIKVGNLTPGEYGFIFRISKMAQFDYNALLGFTIPEQEAQPAANE